MVLLRRTNDKPGLDSLFDEFFNRELPSFFQGEVGKNHPSINVVENKDSYKIEVAAPGFTKDDLKVHVDENMLTISGEFRKEKEDSDERYTRREFNCSSFSRSFNLPETVNAENTKGSYENGILTIELPKLEEVKGVTKEIKIS